MGDKVKGLSFHLCVADILKEVVKLEDVVAMKSRTLLKTEAEWLFCVLQYYTLHWNTLGTRWDVAHIVSHLRTLPWEQPRLEGEEHLHYIDDGCWEKV